MLRNGKRDALLGSGDFHVKEFLPDRMKIESHLSQEAPRGWIDPKDVQAFVTLRNLYGTPASNRRIASQLELAPAHFSFAEFKGYTFHDPLQDGKEERSSANGRPRRSNDRRRRQGDDRRWISNASPMRPTR